MPANASAAYLVVNSDDFGMTEGTNRAILDSHTHGIVTSTSLLANGLAFDHAVALAHDMPTLGVGVHLTLTEGKPLTPLFSGEFPLSNAPYVRAMLTGRLDRRAIWREFEAQTAKIIDAGLRPTHIDGHKYIHLLPGIADIAADTARKFNIPFIRLPRPADPPTPISRAVGLAALIVMEWTARPFTRGLKHADRFVGFADTGHLTDSRLLRLLHRSRPGVTELVCHPAYLTGEHTALITNGYQWIDTYDFERETAAVGSPTVRDRLTSLGWTLTHFGALPH